MQYKFQSVTFGQDSIIALFIFQTKPMKSTIKLYLVLIFMLSVSYNSTAQLQQNYNSFSANLSLPIVVDLLHKNEKINQEVVEKHTPDKQIDIGLYIRIKDLKVDGNSFSGKVIEKTQVSEDIKTLRGEISADGKMIKHIVLTRDYIIYSTSDRERAIIEKETHLLLEIENIPLKYSNYTFNNRVSKIIEVRYDEKRMDKYSHGLKIDVEKFVKLDDKKSYGPSMSFNTAMGQNKSRTLKDDVKIAVVSQTNDPFLKSYSGIIISELMKTPGLIVLERQKISKLLAEIELSESGLVSEETKVKSGRIMMPDIEILFTQENRIPENIELPFERFEIRCKIRIVETGQIIDPNLVFKAAHNVESDQTFTEYAKRVAAFALNFVYD